MKTDRTRPLMHVTRLLTALVAVMALASGTALRAQAPPSLGDVAKKEQERRKALKTAGKVYTKEDLPKTPQAQAPAGAAAPATGAAAAVTPAAGDQKPAAEQKPGNEKDEAWWRARMTQAREELRRSEMFIQALQSRINSLAADFSSRDDPAQRALIGEDRNKAIAEMQRVTAEVEALKKVIADIEEEARQAGVPPGWIR
jgi:hypothetical protein